MASNEEFYVDGRAISELRVVDLKEQLEKRGLSKSGSKVILLKRLKDHLIMEKLQAEQLGKDPSTAPNMEMKTCGNDLVAEYLEKQQQMLQAARMAGGRPVAASSADTSAVSVSTPSSANDSELASPPVSASSSPSKQAAAAAAEVKSPIGGDVDAAAAQIREVASAAAVVPPQPVQIAETVPPSSIITTSEPSDKETGGSGEAAVIIAAQEQQEEMAEVAAVEAETNAPPPPPPSSANIDDAITNENVENPPEAAAVATAEVEQQKETDDTSPSKSKPEQDSEYLYEDAERSQREDNGSDKVESHRSQQDEIRDDEVGRPKEAMAPVSEEGMQQHQQKHEDDDHRQQQDDDQDCIDGGKDVVAEEVKPTAAASPEPDDVEMEISAPINAADELFEAVNTAPPSSTGGKKSENEDSLPEADASADAEKWDVPQRKRKWVAATRSKRTPVSISSDSLKDIVGSVKEEVKEERMLAAVEEEEGPVAPKRIVITRGVSADENASSRLSTDTQRRVEIDTTTRSVGKLTEDGLLRTESPSPARHPPSNIIHIRGLTRPFTLPALHDLLSKYGTFSKEEFWIDGIKSHCIVKYSTEEEATLARERLHNVQWPSSNTKVLRVEFAREEDLDRNKQQERSTRGKGSRDDVREEASEEGRGDARKVERSDDRGRRSLSPSRTAKDRDRSWDRGKTWRAGESPPTDPRGAGGRRRASASPERRASGAKPDQPAPPGKLLDELFRKTKATPCIYWLPLSEEQIRDKERERKKRDQERYERIRKLGDEDRDRRRDQPYRRYSPPHDYRGLRR